MASDIREELVGRFVEAEGEGSWVPPLRPYRSGGAGGGRKTYAR